MTAIGDTTYYALVGIHLTRCAVVDRRSPCPTEAMGTDVVAIWSDEKRPGAPVVVAGNLVYAMADLLGCLVTDMTAEADSAFLRRP